MNNMDALLEAAAEDIKLIDCLGPEDLCLDPSSADGLKPLQLHGLRSRSNRTTVNPHAPAAGASAQPSPQPTSRRRLVTSTGVLQQEAAAAPAVQYGSANATLAAALLAGDFYAPESPAPVSKRPAHTPAQTASPKSARPVIKKPSPEPGSQPAPPASPKFVRPASKKPPPGTDPLASVTAPRQGSVAAAAPAGGNANARTPNRGSSAQPVTRVQRFGASILHYLHDKLKAGKKETLESVIRRDFGNNPDISKALRMLVAEKNVMRVGKGGRADPFMYQLAPAALQKAQDGQHSSETKETVADRQASSAPLGEAASDADTRIVTEPQGPQPLHIQPQALELSSAEAHPAITTAQSLSAVMVGGILEDKKALHHSEPKVSELPICSASLRRSASLPNNLATLPAALKGASDSTVQAAKPDPYNSSATTQGKANSLSGPECYDTKGMSGATHPNLSWGVSNDLQSVHSLPIVPAAVEVVPPCPPDASAPAPAATVFAPHSAVAASAAAAAAGNMPHNLPRNSAAGALYRSAFQPYNSKSSSLGSKATYTADNISSQFRLVCIPGSVAGKNDHTGIQTSQGSQAPTADDKENVLPAATGNESLTSNVLKGLDSMKAFGAVNTSAVSSTRQSFEGTDVRAEACGGSHSGMQEMTAGVHGMPLDLCGPDSTDLGETGASKRAKFTHGFD